MALNTQAYLDAMVSHVAASGYFERVNQHEPANAPGSGLTAAVWADAISPVARASGLAVTSARIAFMLRLYSTLQQSPPDSIDPNLIAAVDALMTAYTGDFTLGNLVMSVDLLGAHGAPLAAQAGYLVQDGQTFRVVTITVPLIVSDVWTQAP